MKPKLTCSKPKCNEPVFQDGLCYKHLCRKRRALNKREGIFIKTKFSKKELKNSDKIACLNSNIGLNSDSKIGPDGQWNHGNNK